MAVLWYLKKVFLRKVPLTTLTDATSNKQHSAETPLFYGKVTSDVYPNSCLTGVYRLNHDCCLSAINALETDTAGNTKLLSIALQEQALFHNLKYG